MEARKAHQARFDKGDVIPQKIIDAERAASAQRAKLRDGIGEELYLQYFPNEQSKVEQAKELEELKEQYKKIKEMRQPRWRRKKVDTTDWKI
jgi:hypothetical protein